MSDRYKWHLLRSQTNDFATTPRMDAGRNRTRKVDVNGFKPATALALALVLCTAPNASARTARVSGHVLAPPASAAGGLVSVPVLLTSDGERRLRAGTPIVRLLVRRHARVSAPRASGSGRVRIKPGKIRPGDRFVARIPLRAAVRRRARRQRMPTLRVRALRLTARAAILSNDELTRLVLALQDQLTALSRRLDDLTDRQASDMASLRGELAALAARVAVLESGLGALQGALTALEADLSARIAELTGDVDDLVTRLTDVEQDVLGLLGQLGILQSAVSGAQTGISGLQTQMSSMSGDFSDLDTAVSGIADRVDTVEAAAADLPDILADVAALDAGLLSLGGQMDLVEDDVGELSSDLGAVTGTVAGLTGDVGTLQSLVGEQQIDIDQLESGTAALGNAVTALESDVGSLEGGLTSLQGQVGALDSELDALGQDVLGLCGALPLACS
jgi:hypothetical protein